jgi:capsid protein
VPRSGTLLSGAAEANVDPGTADAAVTASAPSAAARRFNPYLSNDPSQKARRLARALVSDLVAYHPQKREEGLRAGNLKELFRDEIRKSWAEYVEQVGAPIAEGTTHFQDALNDVLAGGRKVF